MFKILKLLLIGESSHQICLGYFSCAHEQFFLTKQCNSSIDRHYFGHRYYSTQGIRKHYYFGNWSSMQSAIGVRE
jgi:hypothetical protein